MAGGSHYFIPRFRPRLENLTVYAAGDDAVLRWSRDGRCYGFR
jgi:hypothetical protein